MSICCGGTNSFYAPNLPCYAGALPPVCADLLNATIQIIVAQRNAEGLTAVEILNELPVICPDLAMSSDFQDLEDAIAFGVRRGVLCLTYRRSDSAAAYLVNANMTLLNPLNNQYTRCVCEFYSRQYTRPSVPMDHPDCQPCADEVPSSECDPCKALLFNPSQ
jgi:hypothetical protein